MARLRGVMVLAAMRYVEETYGRDAHLRVLKAIPARHCGTLLGPIREASLEPAEDLVAYMETARKLLAPDQPDFHRRLGFFSGRLEREKGGYRPMVADPATTMRMAPLIWSSFYDSGRLEMEIRGPKEAIGHIYDFAVSPVLCQRTCGAWEGIAGSDQQPAHTTELRCVHAGAPHCAIRVLWD